MSLRIKMVVAVGGWMLAGLVMVNQQRSHAEETAESAPCKGRCQIRIEVQGKVPIFNKIPYVAQWFQNGPGHSSEVTECDVPPGHFVTILANGERQVSCGKSACTACEKSKNGCPVQAAVATKMPCAPGLCAADSSDDQVVNHLLSIPCTKHEHHHQHEKCPVSHQHGVSEEVADLRLEIAGLVAALEAQESIMEASNEFFEQLLELSTENARLKQEVEFLHKQQETQQELLTLRAENEKLRTEVELAQQRTDLLKQSAQWAVEHERMKIRISDLEQQVEKAKEPTRTAKQPRTKLSELK